jgi:heme/copper-type cytochrome/quinol oxidase subunit 2
MMNAAALLTFAQAPPADETTIWVSLLVAWAPIVIIAIVIYVVIYFAVKGNNSRIRALHDRSLQHMDRLEAKTDEMIALLKEIRDGQARPRE